MLRKTHIATLLVGVAITGGAIATLVNQQNAETGAVSVSADVPVGTASLVLSPAESTIKAGQEMTVSIVGNTNGDQTRGVDVDLRYDPKVLELVDGDGKVDGVQITPGTVFDFVPDNRVDTASGIVSFSASQQPANQPLVLTNSVIATVTFKAKTTGSSEVTLRHTSGSLSDSNIIKAKEGRDLLNVVGGATVTVN